MEALRNIGIFAHVDAGKTTLSEQLLRHCGAIRTPGAVDEGTAHTDRMDVERRRGISVRATCARMDWRGVRINLIDTPGHADFASEVERSMWALDGAVLLLSAAEGVQPQAETLFKALSRMNLPALIFVNKTDREGADVRAALHKARRLLSPRVFALEGAPSIMEALAEDDEAVLADYLEGRTWPMERLMPLLREAVAARRAFPLLSGSALRDEGVPALLDAIVDLLPPPEGDAQGPLCGAVFAVEGDKTLGRAAHVRLYSGALRNRDVLELPGRGGRTVACKVTQIRDIALEKRGDDIGELRAGEIGTVYGLSGVRVGQVLGDESLLPRTVRPGQLAQPLLMVKVKTGDAARLPALRQALEELSAEDPLLEYAEYGGQPHLSVMGAIQLEILQELLRTRFGLEAAFGPPNVVYRETIARSAVGFYAYTMPKPCWAVIKFQIDPLPRGSGVQFESVTPVREIMQRYQNQVRQAIPLAIRQGMLGWQVDDVKITLIGGEHHLIHTHPLDFIVATPIAFMDGLRRGGSKLLEPVLELTITAPDQYAGRLMSEVTAMRGETRESAMAEGLVRMTALVPLAECVDFSVKLAAITGGRGAMSQRLHGYRDCPPGMSVTCPRRGVHPLDTARYILAARSALEGGIFDE